MSWLRNKIRNWLVADNSSKTIGMANEVKLSTGGSNMLNSDASLNFTVYNAIGGKVIEFRRYDRQSDRSCNTMYVVGKDEDFGEKISKIATLEVMKE